VREARVTVGDETVGAIGPGLLALVGAERGDGPADVAYVVRRLAGLRLFEAADGGYVDVAAAGGGVLVVSQFTLVAELARGRRPDFARAAPRDAARTLVDAVVAGLRALDLPVATGTFGAHMLVHSVNDGPYTLLIDSRARGGGGHGALEAAGTAAPRQGTAPR
jgi:D-tyrosyl-tRNA(Tyr) deacylase